MFLHGVSLDSKLTVAIGVPGVPGVPVDVPGGVPGVPGVQTSRNLLF